MLTLSGRVQRVSTRDVPGGATWQPFVETTLTVADWGSTQYVKLGSRFEGEVPSEGDDVVLKVIVKPYVTREGSRAGFELVGVGLGAVAESPSAPRRAATPV